VLPIVSVAHREEQQPCQKQQKGEILTREHNTLTRIKVGVVIVDHDERFELSQ
jgi:hypothetical protein